MSDEEIIHTLRAMRSCLIRQTELGCRQNECEKCFYYLEKGNLKQQQKALHVAIKIVYEEAFEK